MSMPSTGTVPVNFLVVGLVFDGNRESVSANWVYDPKLTRAIHVDIRYMLWVMDYVDKADHLIREMGLEAQP